MVDWFFRTVDAGSKVKCLTDFFGQLTLVAKLNAWLIFSGRLALVAKLIAWLIFIDIDRSVFLFCGCQLNRLNGCTHFYTRCRWNLICATLVSRCVVFKLLMQFTFHAKCSGYLLVCGKHRANADRLDPMSLFVGLTAFICPFLTINLSRRCLGCATRVFRSWSTCRLLMGGRFLNEICFSLDLYVVHVVLQNCLFVPLLCRF